MVGKKTNQIWVENPQAVTVVFSVVCAFFLWFHFVSDWSWSIKHSRNKCNSYYIHCFLSLTRNLRMKVWPLTESCRRLEVTRLRAPSQYKINEMRVSFYFLCFQVIESGSVSLPHSGLTFAPLTTHISGKLVQHMGENQNAELWQQMRDIQEEETDLCLRL